MLESLGTIMIVSMVGTSVVSLVAGHWLNRKNDAWEPIVGPPEAFSPRPTPLTREIRDELDQTPAWWDRQFHKLLEASGAEPEYKHEQRYWVGNYSHNVQTEHVRVTNYFSECTCSDCKRCFSRYEVMPF